MKKYLLYSTALVFAATGLTSCLDYDDPGDELGWDEIKVDDTKYSGKSDSIAYRRTFTEKGVAFAVEKLESYFGQSKTAQYCMRGGKEGQLPGDHAYQRQFCMGPDNYAQYSVIPHKNFMYGTITSTYNTSKEFNGDPHYSYTEVKNSLVPLLNHPQIDSLPEMKAINLLYLSLSAQERADLSGPFTYFEDKQNIENPSTYVSVKSIYYNIKENLDTIVNCLKYFETRPEWYKTVVNGLMEQYCATTRDVLNGPSGMDPYIRLANSLKLRMAMHMVKVEPVEAQKWAEEAVAGGVIENVEQQQGLYPLISGFGHPLCNISKGWGDTRMSASFESLLSSLNHPYLGYLFNKNEEQLTNLKTGEITPAHSRYCGIREGTLVGDGQSYAENQRIGYSAINADNMQLCPLYFIKKAEVDFLRAEGALRGWNMGGDAQTFYEEGIKCSYADDPLVYDGSECQQKMEEYIKLERPIDYVQIDPMGDGAPQESVTKIGVSWNDADDNETKLEKIITQKYIALFPLSTEAWTEMRRTGYPKVFPVLNTNDGDGSIPQGQMIRRIPWMATDPQFIENINTSGIPALGGPDLQITRLWWDVDKANF